MQISSNQFKQVASLKLADAKVQKALRNAKGKLVDARARVILELDNYEEIRDAAARIRDFSLQHMDVLLEAWEEKALAAGTIVHWAETPRQVNDLVIEIARNHAVRKIIKSKSMLGEETNLNHALEAAGLDVREIPATPERLMRLRAEAESIGTPAWGLSAGWGPFGQMPYTSHRSAPPLLIRKHSVERYFALRCVSGRWSALLPSALGPGGSQTSALGCSALHLRLHGSGLIEGI